MTLIFDRIRGIVEQLSRGEVGISMDLGLKEKQTTSPSLKVSRTLTKSHSLVHAEYRSFGESRQSVFLVGSPFFSIFDVSYSENTCSIYGSSMTLTIRRLTTKLHLARRRVRRLEMLLYLAQREEAARCDHLWVKADVNGPRDNGECWYRCSKCGSTK